MDGRRLIESGWRVVATTELQGHTYDVIESPQGKRELVVELRAGELVRLWPTPHVQTDAELEATLVEPLTGSV